jgi:peptidoglycan/LPS O-acetylase OafA/YrhL
LGGHILSLDSYRFLAASLIVVLHYDSDFGLRLSSMLPTVRALDLFVDFFFILSGFVIARTYASRVSSLPAYFTFLQRRAARIYPLHLLTLVFVIVMVLGAQAMHAPINHPEVYDWRALPATVFLVQAWGELKDNVFNLPAWSISAELFVYLLFPMFVALGNRLPFAVNGLLIVAFAALFQVSGLVPPDKHWTHVNAEFGNLRAVPTFFLGVLMSLAFDRTVPRVIIGWRAIRLLFVACVAAPLAGLPDELILVGSAAVLFCGAQCRARRRADRPGGPLLRTTGRRLVRNLPDASGHQHPDRFRGAQAGADGHAGRAAGGAGDLRTVRGAVARLLLLLRKPGAPLPLGAVVRPPRSRGAEAAMTASASPRDSRRSGRHSRAC